MPNNDGPALLVTLLGAFLAAKGTQVAQQIGVARIGVGAAQLITPRFQQSC
jgi:DNA-binding phage protein